MNEPTRWVDGQAPEGALELLRAGLEESPSDRCLSRTLAAVGGASLGLSVAATAKAGVVAATAKGTSGSMALLFGKAFAVSLLVGGGVIGTVAAVQHYRSGPAGDFAVGRQQLSKPRPKARELTTPNGVAARDSEKAPNVAVAPVVAHEPPTAAETPVGVASRPHASAVSSALRARPVPAQADASFAEEVAYLDRMRAQLRSGDARGTLTRATEYGKRADFGHFVPEALYLRMEAYRKLGNQAEAIRTAQDIVTRFPRSAQARSASSLLESEGRGNAP